MLGPVALALANLTNQVPIPLGLGLRFSEGDGRGLVHCGGLRIHGQIQERDGAWGKMF